MDRYQATVDFVVFAEKKLAQERRLREEIPSHVLINTARRWCAGKYQCQPLLAGAFSGVLRSRGWTSRRVSAGIMWVAPPVFVPPSPADAAAADAEAEAALLAAVKSKPARRPPPVVGPAPDFNP